MACREFKNCNHLKLLSPYIGNSKHCLDEILLPEKIAGLKNVLSNCYGHCTVLTESYMCRHQINMCLVLILF